MVVTKFSSVAEDVEQESVVSPEVTGRQNEVNRNKRLTIESKEEEIKDLDVIDSIIGACEKNKLELEIIPATPHYESNLQTLRAETTPVNKPARKSSKLSDTLRQSEQAQNVSTLIKSATKSVHSHDSNSRNIRELPAQQSTDGVMK